jgi:hypothetical protein
MLAAKPSSRTKAIREQTPNFAGAVDFQSLSASASATYAKLAGKQPGPDVSVLTGGANASLRLRGESALPLRAPFNYALIPDLKTSARANAGDLPPRVAEYPNSSRAAVFHPSGML